MISHHNDNYSNNFILQWNCNGFYSKLNNLKILIQNFYPNIICIQESRLSPKVKVNLNTYNAYRHDYIPSNHYAGSNGVITLVHKSLYSCPLPLQTDLQAVAVKVFHPTYGYINVCNVYMSHNIVLTLAHLQSLYNQLPKPCFIVGDFNAHHFLWGSLNQNPRGRVVESFLLNNGNICLLNDGSPTHFHLGHKVFTHIDVSLVSDSLLPHVNWSIHEDLNFSEHFPIIISFNQSLSFSVNDSFQPWSYARADWCKYQDLTSKLKEISQTNNINDSVDLLNNIILNASSQAIPKCIIKRKCVPWWSSEIYNSIKQRKKALKKYRKNPTIVNLIEFKKLRAKARLLINSQRNVHWISFLSSINKPIDQKTMWSQLRRVKGKYPYNPITIIKNSSNEIISSPQTQCEIFALHFSSISKSENYDQEFQIFKTRLENVPLINSSNNDEPYNIEFNLNELELALKNCKSSATGPDLVSYPMLKNLTKESKEHLLALYNQIWIKGTFPETWKTSIIIPILKPGRNPKEPINYRPISLISCVSKIFEKMVNHRLRWILESNKLLSEHQNGCIRNKSTLDSLAVIQHHILKAFASKEKVVAISLDIKKAFDLTWRHKVLLKLKDWNIQGRIFIYLQQFLNDRKIQVKVKNCISPSYPLENGILQGSSLSSTLWNIVISDVTKCIPISVKYSIYVDDIFIYMSHINLKFIEQTLQNVLNSLASWSKENGSQFSEEKTKVIVFSKRKFKHQLNLNFNGVTLQESDNIKLLGMIMDYRLKWKDHINYTKARATKSLNILQILNNRNNGVSRQVLLRLYKTYIRPIIEYGAPIYNSAPKALLDKLEPAQNAAIRLATGAFKSSRIENLLIDAGEPPLMFRREYLCNNYISKVLCNNLNPMQEILLNISNYDLNVLFQNESQPLSVWFYKNTSNINDILPNLRLPNISIPPWMLLYPKFDHLKIKGKKFVIPMEIKNKFFEYLSNNCPVDSTICYTDGSKDGNTVGAAFKISNFVINHRLHKMCSSFTAEAFAMESCLSHLFNSHTSHNIMIFTDSSSLIASMQQNSPNNVIIQNIQRLCHSILAKGIRLGITWIPSHCGIPGNEHVDLAAKSPLYHNISNDLILPDLKNHLKAQVKIKWQEWWDIFPPPNKIKDIKLTVHPWPSSNRKIRIEEKILCRLRIGHTRLTHGYLMEKSDPPICDYCSVQLTIEHILCVCIKFIAQRRKLNLYNKEIDEILGDDPHTIDKVMEFLKEIHIFKEI